MRPGIRGNFMVVAAPRVHPRVEVRVGRDRYPATPVFLEGHAASVVMDHVPATERHRVLLVLGWEDGSATTLDARVRAVHSNGHVAHFDVQGVEGDWGPFLAYLGGAIAGSPSPAA